MDIADEFQLLQRQAQAVQDIILPAEVEDLLRRLQQEDDFLPDADAMFRELVRLGHMIEANTNDVTTHVSVAGPLTVAVAESLKTVDAPSDGHDCPICMEDDNSAAWKETPCEHRFHGRCVERWLQAKGSCPMCRRQLVTMPAAAAPSTAGFSDLELDAIVDLVNY
ncbi:uncharacterized protein [Aegilops tauschii subsp. strangulata]|uniref:RING-type domain-containing protein n=1 Tax=Aegilops tauschii subsp. strangulata TaxID=200361 RepID=A0A453QM99_AEGTS|nr:E3 ubiquitin-protein ligase RNF181 homolog [Aegilops tauschii subsp. strangulata]